MLEVKVPQDIRKYETKILGPLSGRQLVLGVAAVASLVFVTFVLSAVLPTSLCRILQVLSIMPFAAFMFIKPYGMPLEKFLTTILYSTILSSSKRKYANKNSYKSIAHKVELIEKEKAKKAKKAPKESKAKKGGKR